MVLHVYEVLHGGGGRASGWWVMCLHDDPPHRGTMQGDTFACGHKKMAALFNTQQLNKTHGCCEQDWEAVQRARRSTAQQSRLAKR
jgi:hypothetical protein